MCLPPVSSVDALWELQSAHIASWLSGGVAKSTRRQYASKIKEWRAFALKYHLRDHDLFTRATYSSSQRALTLFVYEMKNLANRTSDYIKRTLQALRLDLITNSYDVAAFSDPTVLLARKAAKEPARILHKRRQSQHRLPVTFDIISWLGGHLSTTGSFDDFMTYCGILLSFNFMLRCSEYCHTPEAPHALLCEDVSFITSTGETLTPGDIRHNICPLSGITDIIMDLCSSKPDRDGKGRRLILSRTNGNTDSNFIDTLYHFTLGAAHRSPQNPFLSRYNGNRRKKLHRGMVSTALKLAARHFGIDEFYFSSHSLRIGGATSGAAGGRSRSSLCRTGGWSELSTSDALYRQITPQDRGILSLVDEGAHLLSTKDLRSMVPNLHKRPRV